MKEPEQAPEEAEAEPVEDINAEDPAVAEPLIEVGEDAPRSI
jgi:hypothetical protein